MTTSPPSSAIPIAATSRAASALPVARLVGAAQSARTMAGTRRVVSSAEIMPLRYRAPPLVTIGLPGSRRREIPTAGPLGALPAARAAAGTVDRLRRVLPVRRRRTGPRRDADAPRDARSPPPRPRAPGRQDTASWPARRRGG